MVSTLVVEWIEIEICEPNETGKHQVSTLVVEWIEMVQVSHVP